jgi:chromosome partitioning protein
MLTEGLKSLKTMLRDTAALQAEGLKKATVISLCSQKGGVGKTTSAVNLAYNLAEHHEKDTLLVDLDPQGHVETSLTALIPDGQRYRPLSSVLLEKRPNLMETIVKTRCERLSVTPGDRSLIETEGLLTTKIGKEFMLREAIRIAATHFDFVILDCPPNLGNLTLNALVTSHYCIVPCEMSALSLEGVSDIFETIETINERLNRSLAVLGILLTRVDARNITLNNAVRAQLDQHARTLLFETEIPVNSALSKAQLVGKPASIFSHSSSGASQYRAWTDELLSRLEDLAPENEPGHGFRA